MNLKMLIMKRQLILLLLISLFTVGSPLLWAQQDGGAVNDTIIKNKYGLRVGVDLFNPTAALVDDNCLLYTSPSPRDA